MSLIRPSYKQGFARNAAESEHPGLWTRLQGAWFASLGASGSTFFDWGGRRLDASPTGTITWAPGRLGWQSELGTNAYWSFPEISLGKRYTLLATVTRLQVFGHYLLRGFDINQMGMFLLDSPERIYQYLSDGTNVNINISIPVGEPIQIGITREGTSTIQYYRNGVNVGSDNCTDVAMSVSQMGAVGARQNAIHMTACWDRALTPSEIAIQYDDHRALIRPRSRVIVKTPAAGGTILPQMIQQGLYMGSAT